MQKIFTVYDEKAEAYLPPFFLNTNGEAIRAITDCVNDLNHQFGKHPSDYTLFSLGTYDPQSGTFENEKAPLGNLLEFKTQPVMYENDNSKIKLVEGE